MKEKEKKGSEGVSLSWVEVSILVAAAILWWLLFLIATVMYATAHLFVA